MHAVAAQISQAPILYQLAPVEAPKILDESSQPHCQPDVEELWVTVAAEVGNMRVGIVRPQALFTAWPPILYTHSRGWILGNACTHDRLVRKLTIEVRAVVVFVECTPSHDARYPVALQQACATPCTSRCTTRRPMLPRTPKATWSSTSTGRRHDRGRG